MAKTFLVRNLIGRVEHITQDEGVAWPRVELQDWLNDAYKAIVNLRPDANSSIENFTCVADSLQDVSTSIATAIRILDVRSNIAATSNKGSVTLVEADMLDSMLPFWRGETGSVNIENWMFDPDTPLLFQCYPPALATTELEVVVSKEPGTHALSEAALDPDGVDATTILLNDIYVPALIDYVLYRAFSKAGSYANNATRSQTHLSAFALTITGKSKVDQSVTPGDDS